MIQGIPAVEWKKTENNAKLFAAVLCLNYLSGAAGTNILAGDSFLFKCSFWRIPAIYDSCSHQPRPLDNHYQSPLDIIAHLSFLISPYIFYYDLTNLV